ncbi:uncharacterized protein LOC111114844 isoform X2 [Crassostrea virginica]
MDAMDGILNTLFCCTLLCLTHGHANGCSISGYYGENCSFPCPQNCRDGLCDSRDGTCLICIAGYTGPRCEEACKDNTYGEGCVRACGNCKNREPCDHVNGSCPNGCAPGYQGVTCDTGCLITEYGMNCPVLCSNNCIGMCSHVTGHCEAGCQAGWRGPTCDTKCDGGRYGRNCSEICGGCHGNEQCNHIDGTCPNGCNRGYSGDRCTQSKDFNLFKNSLALGHPFVDQSSRHDPESIAVFCFAALLFTSFVLILVMLVKLRRSRIQENGPMQGNNEEEIYKIKSHAFTFATSPIDFNYKKNLI